MLSVFKEKAEVGSTISARIPYLDYSRLFVAFLVVLGHLLPANDTLLRPFIYAFHMPFFILVSGMLHKYNGTIQFEKYLRTIIRPFIFFNLCFLLIHPIMFKLGFGERWNVPNVSSTDDLISIYISFIKYRILHNSGCFDGPTWFLLALLWCKIGLDLLLKKWILIIVFPIAIFIAYMIKAPTFYLRQAIQLFPFFFVGFYFKDYINGFLRKNTSSNRLIPIILIFIASTIILTLLNGRVTWLRSHFGKLPLPFNLVCSYINAFVGSFAFLLLSTLFKPRLFVLKTANALITILCMQNLFIYTYWGYWGFSGFYFVEFILSILILILCVFIHLFLAKKVPWLFGKKGV